MHIYYKCPRMVQHYISVWRYHPKIGKRVQLGGWSTFSENVTIGDYSYLQQNNFMKNVEIGRFCAIASGLTVGLNEHPYTSFSNFRMSAEHSPFKDRKKLSYLKNAADIPVPRTIIGNDVWIGQNVTIKAGVKIGNGAILGTGAVVTKDVPPYAIVAGVPAKLIKYRFSEEKIDYLQKTEWWNLPLDQLWEKLPELDRFGGIEDEAIKNS